MASLLFRGSNLLDDRRRSSRRNALADSIGKALPDWTVTDAQNAKKDVKLADFKGKWVLLEFWGFG
jgi:hypothetical protein